MKSVLNTFFKYALAFILMLCSGYLLLAFSYTVPVNGMQKHLQESAKTFDKEGVYPSPADSILDNWTDARMMLIAAYPNTENIWKASLRSSTFQITGENPVGILVKVFTDKNAEFDHWDYYRYWHGYLIFLKPLLYFFDYSGIRNIMCLVQLLLLFVTFLQTGKNRFLMFPIIGAFIFLDPVSEMLSMQYWCVWTIILIFLMLILRYAPKWQPKHWGLCFMIFGCLTSYFDLLTYPITALGLPLIFILCLQEQKSFSRMIVYAIAYSAAWVSGYVLFWAAKWIIGSIVLHKDIIMNAWNKILQRTGHASNGSSYTYSAVLSKNIRFLDQPSIWILSGITIILLIRYVVKCIKTRSLPGSCTGTVPLLVSFFPFIWYAFTPDHSANHAFFTWKNFVIVYFSVNMFLVMNLYGNRETASPIINSAGEGQDAPPAGSSAYS